MTSGRAELLGDAAASPGRGAGLAPAHPLPGEAGTGSGVQGPRLEGAGVVSHSRPPFTAAERAGGRGGTAAGEAGAGGERG